MKKQMKRIMALAMSVVMIATVFAGVPAKKVQAASKRFVDVSCGPFHSAAVDEDGKLWMWGYNKFCQLGDGSTEDRKQPVNIMKDVVKVSLGGASRCGNQEGWKSLDMGI